MHLLNRLPRVDLAAYLFYLGIAIFITWPLVTVFATRLAGDGFSDSTELVRHIWWIKHALQTGQPIIFQPLLAYPNGLDGAWLWGNPLQSFPAWLFAFVLPLPAAYNLMILLRLALNGWAMYWLALHLTKQRGPALLSGLVFMAYPTFQGQLSGGHAGLLVVWPVPLYVWALLRLHETGQRRWIVIAAALFVLSVLGSNLLLVYMLFPITALFVFRLLLARDRKALLRLGSAVALGSLGALVFILPVARETAAAPEYIREIGGYVDYSADLLAIVTPSFYHPVFGHLDYTHRVLGVNTVEHPAYLGIAAGLLAIIGLWRRREARWWLALAAMAWLFSLGPLLKVLDQPVQMESDGYPSYLTLPWLALQQLPLLNIARAPARFHFTLALSVAVMAGYGATTLMNRFSVGARHVVPLPLTWMRNHLLQGIILAVLMAFTLWEYQFFWSASPNVFGLFHGPDFPTIPGVVPDAVAALAQRDDLRAVFDIPWYHPLTDKDALFLQTGHQHPLIAGHVTRFTPVDPARLTLLQETLDPTLLDAAGADVIILHKRWDEENGVTEAFTRRQLGEPFYEDTDIAIWEAPQATGEPHFTAVTPAIDPVPDDAETYFYAPETGWVLLSGALEANGRTVALYLDGIPIHRWYVDESLAFDVPVPVASTGYHTLSMSPVPTCPQRHDLTLRCRALHTDDLTLTFTPAPLEAMDFGQGLRLAGAYVPQTALTGDDALAVWLWWQFDESRSDQEVRFVHILDAAGNPVAQMDSTLGQQATGGQWTEAVTLALPDGLATGTYEVYAGWYTYPDLTRFPVLMQTPRAEDGLAFVGVFQIGE